MKALTLIVLILFPILTNANCVNASNPSECLQDKMNSLQSEMKLISSIDRDKHLDQYDSHHCPEANVSQLKLSGAKFLTGHGETFKEARNNLFKGLPTIGVLSRVTIEENKYLESNSASVVFNESKTMSNNLNARFNRFTIYDCRLNGEYFSTAIVPKRGTHYLPAFILDYFNDPNLKKYLNLSYVEKLCPNDSVRIEAIYNVLESNVKVDWTCKKDSAITDPTLLNSRYPSRFNLFVPRQVARGLKNYSSEYELELLSNLDN